MSMSSNARWNGQEGYIPDMLDRLDRLEQTKGWTLLKRAETIVEGDQALVHRAQNGDITAMESLLDRHRGVAWTVCLSILPHSDAQDALQEAFIKVLGGLPRFRRQASFRTWLLRIVTNTCLDFRRKSSNEALRICDTGTRDHLQATSESPETVTLQRAQLTEALAQLQPRQRALLVLREAEDLSAREIGEVMGWNEQKVKNELFKARQILRQWQEKQAAIERD